MDKNQLLAYIGTRIAELRKERGLSQRELARKVGTVQCKITNIERGGANPTIASLAPILDALGAEMVIRQK